MAENKKSFILYADLISTVENLPDAKAGKLFKTILEYVNDRNPEVKDLLVLVAFEPIKQQLKRDLKEWEKERQDRSEAGKIGMAKRWAGHKKITKNNKNNSVINPITKITDTVTVTDNVTVEIQTNNTFFEMFRRAAGYSIQDSELRQEVGKFRNKYPNVHPNQAGALINTWVSNIGKEQTPIKKMVL